MKKKRKSFLIPRRQGKGIGGNWTHSLTQVAIIETESEINVQLSADTVADTIGPISPASCMSVNANIVSPEKDPDDYSLYIVHNFVDGEITGVPKLVEDSLSGATTRTSSAGRITDTDPGQFSWLQNRINDFIPAEVRSYTSFKSNGDKINNSLLDDDISAISFDRKEVIRYEDIKSDEFVEDASMATRNVGNGCALAKQRMIENILAVKFAQNAKGCEMKLRDDESSYVTFDLDEWEQEFGGGCCFTKQLHGVVMETGKAVYDWAGEPEDYPLGRQLVSVCDDGRKCGTCLPSN